MKKKNIDVDDLIIQATTLLPELFLDDNKIEICESNLRKTCINLGAYGDNYKFTSVAKMTINIGIYPNMSNDELFDILDAENADMSDTILSIIDYREKTNYREERYCPKIAIVELHELYIDPEYRGMGLAQKILLRLPLIIETYFNIDCGYIGTYINPYKTQLSISEMDGEDFEYCDEDIEQDVYIKMRKTIEAAGFKAISRKKKEKHFVTSFSSIYKQAKRNNMNYGIQFI